MSTKLEQLERFYRQIGTLNYLEHLELRAIDVGPDPGVHLAAMVPYRRMSFPGMLYLPGDGASEQPGYLQLLSGLTKLRILRGSVSATTEEISATMGWPEAQWMVTPWTGLEVAEFFDQDEDATEPFQ
ncbi:hypothetical protein BGX23_003602, partial [Mortierella sp. AD031]